MTHQTATADEKPFLILGHRGSPRKFPENTIPSFDAALSAGADGFETDLRRLADGVEVLFHDDQVGDRVVEDLTFSSLARSAVDLTRLEELARYSSARRLMVLEIKRSGWEVELLEKISGWNHTIISSFDHRVLAQIARLDPRRELGVVIDSYLMGAGQYARSIGARWYFPQFRWVDRELVESMSSLGIGVIPWTVNDETSWTRSRALGCRGVITDLPEAAVRWRHQSV